MSDEVVANVVWFACGFILVLIAVSFSYEYLIIKNLKKLGERRRSAIAKAEEAQLFYHESLKDLKSKNRCEGDEWKDG